MNYLAKKQKGGPARTCFRGGFTIIELMVAVAVFSIVMVTAMSALLNVIDANNKARAIKTAINNISFALEGISKDMRMGTDYQCGGDFPSLTGDGCTSQPGTAISYKSPRAFPGGKVFYRFNEAEKQLEECLQKTNGGECNSDADFRAITSADATLTKVNFYVLNNDPSGSLVTQPKMILTISGKAGNKEKIKTEFNLQTSVSQRIRDDIN